MFGRPSFNKRPPLPGEHAARNAELLQEIESLNRALSLPHPSNPRPKSTPYSSSQKKTSFWNWKPLKALSHIRQRRFDCVFSLHVHSIENLPVSIGDAALSVHWRRTSDPLSSAAGTSSVHTFDGVAEFDETLNYRCSVYGARKSSGHPAAKYEARHFVIYVSVSNAPELDFGKQLVDVTRLLPLTLEELEDVENSSGKWSTSFRLSGTGKGASLNVSFGFSLIGDGSLKSSSERNVVDAMNLKMPDEGSIGRARNKSRRWARSQSVEDVRVLHEVLPSSKSVTSLLVDAVEKLEIDNCKVRELCDLEIGSKPKPEDFCKEDEVIKLKPHALIDHFEGNYSKELEEPGFDVEIPAKDQQSTLIFENIDLKVVDQGSQFVSKEVEESCEVNCDYKESKLLNEHNPTAMELQDFAFDVLSVSEPEGWAALHSEAMTPNPINNEKESMQNKSFSFIDSKEAAASQSPFGLSSYSDPESPRERLWKQFEEETLGAGSLIFGFDIETELDDKPCEEHNLSEDSEDFDLSNLVLEAEMELHRENQCLSHNSRAKFLEVAEAEDLMIKWGLNEKAFQCSPPTNNDGFDSLIDLPTEMKLSSLGEGLGPFVQTKDGGFLKSMSPYLFRNSKNNTSLIMQVSSPVVVPAEMGSDIMEILHRLASIGIEKLSVQAKNLMPLEDVSGKTMQQIAWEATTAVDACKRETDVVISQKASGRKKEGSLNLASLRGSDRDSEYVSIEDLAPLAMDKIEALCIEGLRIQSGMSDEEAPSNISPQFIGNMATLEGEVSINDSFLGLEGAAGLQLLDVKGNADDVDGLMSLSITLDEWLKLDSGILDNEDQNSDRTSKILAAHGASSPNLITGGWKQERTEGKRSVRRWGLLGSNFTAGLMVQLRDPLRNYEPVGTPMLALVQVERVVVPPKPKIYTVSEKGNCDEDDEAEPEHETKTDPPVKKKKEEEIPQFKITEVHVAGLRTESNRKRIWGNPMQQQSGSRWLLANGMGKSNKHPLMKSKASPVTAAVQTGDALWSISSHFHGTGSKWKEMPAKNPHFRNPNINFPKETMNLR